MTQSLEKESDAFSSAIQLDAMSETEREAALGKLAGLALEAALGRLLLVLEESEQMKLELYLDSHPQGENTIDYLLKTYPRFNDFLEEEVQALQVEAVTVLG
jgi:hypothetical protein